MRVLAILLVAAALPGCVAAALVSAAVISSENSASASRLKQSRLEYIAQRRSAGLSDEAILLEIKTTDPQWYEDATKHGNLTGMPPRSKRSVRSQSEESEKRVGYGPG